MSPTGADSLGDALTDSIFGSAAAANIRDHAFDTPGEPMNLIIQSFAPRIAVHTSEDTDVLLERKGFKYGLWELLRPFGEKVHGKVTARDSHGVSRTFEDFSVRFTRFGENVEHPDVLPQSNVHVSAAEGTNGVLASADKDKAVIADVENLVEQHLTYAETSTAASSLKEGSNRSYEMGASSPYYSLFLRRILSNTPLVPHETFAHPVACIIAISSRNPTPIEELRKLYVEGNQGERRLPAWVDNDYLRYYVLVHDEEVDDISKSMTLFDQMKRHLGLHCHLLRLRGSETAETDEDSIPMPGVDWISAKEELAQLQRRLDEDAVGKSTQYIFESDATALRTFVREMVTQSVVPTMERHISIWNDQVASRRRGITGRFMNLSRKLAGFGSSSRSSSGGGTGSKDSYDAGGFFRSDAAEAIIRRLADFAFMLRDWRLAASTYDLLRSDFNEYKAWKYYAAANEMAAVSLLMTTQPVSSKTRAESLDQMLESAFYSYNTRCEAPFGALRSLLMGQELLRLKGGSNIDAASTWGLRLLDSKILGPVGDALLKERLSICYMSKSGVGSSKWGSRGRKSAFWSVFAADAWNQQGMCIPAYHCLCDAQIIYESLAHSGGVSRFVTAAQHLNYLQNDLISRLGLDNGESGPEEGDDSEALVDIESEALSSTVPRRASMVARGGALETAPLRSEASEQEGLPVPNAEELGFR